jgi:uncharacterized protein
MTASRTPWSRLTISQVRLLVCLLAACFMGQAAAASVDKLAIETADGRTLAFTVEVQHTPEELARGLMNRPSLPADAGMLFDFGSDRPVSMWMKNTLIPLDMVFIDKDGRITGIAQRAVPYSLEVIPSPGPVRAVLEINGGVAEKLGIRTGDRVAHSLFRPAGARN